MTVKIAYLNKKGHTPLELTVEEAERLIEMEKGRYFVCDATTGLIQKEVKIDDGQELVLLPIIGGGCD